MADHSAQIAKIQALLRSGASTVTVDGVAVSIDRADLRRQLRELITEDDASQAKRRPMVVSQYLGGF